jgi:hypothetical protein
LIFGNHGVLLVLLGNGTRKSKSVRSFSAWRKAKSTAGAAEASFVTGRLVEVG